MTHVYETGGVEFRSAHNFDQQPNLLVQLLGQYNLIKIDSAKLKHMSNQNISTLRSNCDGPAACLIEILDQNTEGSFRLILDTD